MNMKSLCHSFATGILLALAVVFSVRADPLDHWYLRRPPHPTNVLNSVIYGNGLFVAVGGEILTSPDGTVWSRQDPGTSNRLSRVAYGKGRFVAVGSPATAVMSTNGVVWTPSTNPSSSYAIAYGNNVFVAIGCCGVSTSTDGLSWSPSQPSGIRTSPSDIIYAGGRFVVVGGNPFILVASVWASTNGTDWFESGPLAGP